MKIVSKPDHGAVLIEKGVATDVLQDFFDDLIIKLNVNLGESFVLPAYTVAALPSASKSVGGLIYVSDETGGAVTAFSDGTNWRRTTDRAVVS